jgi:hypothetical protein
MKRTFAGHVEGDLTLNATDDISALTSIGGGLIVRQGATFEAPVLTSIGGGLVVRQGATFEAPVLTSIGGETIATPDAARTLLRAVAERALASDTALDMTNWHSCETTHCIAGWAIHLSGERGAELERTVGSSTGGAVLLGVEAAKLFRVNNDTAREWLRAVLADAPNTSHTDGPVAEAR